MRKDAVFGGVYCLKQLIRHQGLTQTWLSLKNSREDSSCVLKFEAILPRSQRQRQEHQSINQKIKNLRTLKVLDYFQCTIQKQLYLVTVTQHYVEEDFSRICNDRNPNSAKIKLFYYICSTLDRAHCKGILHGNLKPENMFILGDSASLGDFSAAFLVQRQIKALNTACPVPPYMSPQFEREGRYNQAGEVWAMGIIMLEIILCKRIWQTPQFENKPLCINFAALEPWIRKAKDVEHYQVGLLISQMLAASPRKRISMQETVKRLRGILNAQGTKIPANERNANFEEKQLLVEMDLCSRNKQQYLSIEEKQDYLDALQTIRTQGVSDQPENSIPGVLTAYWDSSNDLLEIRDIKTSVKYKIVFQNLPRKNRIFKTNYDLYRAIFTKKQSVRLQDGKFAFKAIVKVQQPYALPVNPALKEESKGRQVSTFGDDVAQIQSKPIDEEATNASNKRKDKKWISDLLAKARNKTLPFATLAQAVPMLRRHGSYQEENPQAEELIQIQEQQSRNAPGQGFQSAMNNQMPKFPTMMREMAGMMGMTPGFGQRGGGMSGMGQIMGQMMGQMMPSMGGSGNRGMNTGEQDVTEQDLMAMMQSGQLNPQVMQHLKAQIQRNPELMRRLAEARSGNGFMQQVQLAPIDQLLSEVSLLEEQPKLNLKQLGSKTLTLSMQYSQSGLLKRAIQTCECSIRYFQICQNWADMARAYTQLAFYYQQVNQPQNCINCCYQAKQYRRKANIDADDLDINNLIASAYFAHGNTEEAMNLYNQVIQRAKTTNNAHSYAAASSNLGIILNQKGRSNQALAMHLQALRIYEQTGRQPINLLKTSRSISRILLSQGKIQEALKYIKKCFDVLEQIHKNTQSEYYDLVEETDKIIEVILNNGCSAPVLQQLDEFVQKYMSDHDHLKQRIASELNKQIALPEPEPEQEYDLD